jgi:ribulose kinase
MGKVIVIDAVTGNVVEREQTDAEKAQTTADIAESKAQDKAAADKAKAKQAVLDKLGLTADEVAALLG